MELIELKDLIIGALADCEQKLQEEPEIVLSEADFERLVSWSIMNRLGHSDYRIPQKGDFTVHTQVSHYFDGIPSPLYRVDILLLTKEGMENAKNQKEFVYRNDSFALELKYFHGNDTLSRIKEIKCDFCKRKLLDQNSWLYVVALIEEDDDDTYNKKKKIIDSIGDEEENGKDNLFHYVLRKRRVYWNQFNKTKE